MGAGIVEVFARNGFDVDRRRDQRRGGRARPRAPRALDRPRRGPRQAHRGRSATRCSAGSRFDHRPRRPGRRRPGHRGGAGAAGPQAARSSRELDGICRARRDPGHQHLLAVGHRDLGRRPRRPTGSSACTSSTRRRCMKLVEVVRTVVTEPEVRRRRRGARRAGSARPTSTIGDRAGFIANALLFGYLNHAVVDVRGAVRHPRGHRRRDEARLRPADGPAGAARPDRPRHRVRDPRHDVPQAPRPAARAGADPQADGHRRAARPQDRPRLLHLRRPGLAGRGRRRARRRRPATPPSGARPIAQVGVVGSGTMATGIVEVFAKAGYDVLYVGARRRTRSTSVARDGQALAGQGGRSAAS